MHSLLSFAWTLTRQTNFNRSRQNIAFSYSERIPVSFSWLFHSFSFFLLFYAIINFYKNYYYYYYYIILASSSMPYMTCMAILYITNGWFLARWLVNFCHQSAPVPRVSRKVRVHFEVSQGRQVNISRFFKNFSEHLLKIISFIEIWIDNH